jgi:hypothetical protein
MNLRAELSFLGSDRHRCMASRAASEDRVARIAKRCRREQGCLLGDPSMSRTLVQDSIGETLKSAPRARFNSGNYAIRSSRQSRADAAMRGFDISFSTSATVRFQVFCCDARNIALIRSMWT